jgi:hypothetical protein
LLVFLGFPFVKLKPRWEMKDYNIQKKKNAKILHGTQDDRGFFCLSKKSQQEMLERLQLLCLMIHEQEKKKKKSGLRMAADH